MNLFQKVRVYLCLFKRCLNIALFRKARMIFLFGSPFHCNMGDQAQTYCIINWFKEYYFDYGIYIFRLPETHPILLRVLRKTIRKKDMLVFHSGYHMTDLYHEQDVYCKVIQLFPDYPIIVFPQTINYLNEKRLVETALIFNSHKRIILMCRDEQSYKIAQENFVNCKLLLYPDIVTSLIGTRQYNYERKGVLFCMRNDIEAYYTPLQIDKLRARFGNIEMMQTDTTISTPILEIYKYRERVLNDILAQYAHYKVIITDRYHGTIFSLIANTPVVVISSTDHKLSSGVKWFPKEFEEYVSFAQDLNEAYEKAFSILMNPPVEKKLPQYFREKYYNVLKENLLG